MVNYQSWNPKTKRWVKYKIKDKAFIPLDVKQRDKTVPFKNVKIRRRKK